VTVLLCDSGVARIGVYADDDDLNVWSPQASAQVDVGSGVEVEGGWTADVITAATVDVRTAATPRGSYHETRHEVHVGPRWEPAAGSALFGGYTLSVERDYTSHVATVGAARETWGRRLTLTASARLLEDTVGRAGEPGFERRLRGRSGEIGADVVLGLRTVAGMTVSVQRLEGYQSSPYRRVTIRDETGVPRTSLDEQVPDERTRPAASLSLRQALPLRLFAMGSYRFYADSWGVRSHTGELDLSRSVARDRAAWGLHVRGYSQGQADFHEARYDTYPLLPQYRSADKKLGRTRSVLAGVRGEWAPGGALGASRLEASADVYDQWFLDFEPLRRRIAALLAVGWSAEW
jgi:hypothetical protein